jgi:hypothetical protein
MKKLFLSILDNLMLATSKNISPRINGLINTKMIVNIIIDEFAFDFKLDKIFLTHIKF